LKIVPNKVTDKRGQRTLFDHLEDPVLSTILSIAGAFQEAGESRRMDVINYTGLVVLLFGVLLKEVPGISKTLLQV
jgi:hypothetical protein